MSKTNNTSLVLSALMAAVLAGCGGGGGSDDSTVGGNTGGAGTPNNSTAPDLQLSVPAPTYAAGSDELAAWNLMNQALGACGFGLMKQDARLDAAAKAHANYQILNNVIGHDEIAGMPGFTGVTGGDRAKAQGFNGTAGESIAHRVIARDSMIDLLTAPYHAMASLWGWKSVGISSANNRLVVVYGNEDSNTQRLGAGVVANYPCEGAQNVAPSWYQETPNPFPDLPEFKGTPILLFADKGSSLLVANFSIIRESTGQSIPYRTLTKDNDRNGRFASNEYAAVPIEALTAGESYRVTYSGTLNGSQIGKTFTFKTITHTICQTPATGETYWCFK